MIPRWLGALWLWLGQNKDAVSATVAILGVAGGLGSGMYAAISYGRSVADTRQQAAVAYLDKYRSGEIAKTRQAHALFWLQPQQRELLNRVVKETEPDAKRAAVKRLRMVVKEKVQTDAALRGHVYELSRFYRDLSVCVLDGQCELLTACKTFGREVKGFYGLYVEFLVDWSRLWGERVEEDMKQFWWKCDAEVLQSHEPSVGGADKTQ